MVDPVICSDGTTYERAAIEAWLAGHSTSPLTNLPLEHTDLVPNLALRELIYEYTAKPPPLRSLEEEILQTSRPFSMPRAVTTLAGIARSVANLTFCQGLPVHDLRPCAIQRRPGSRASWVLNTEEPVDGLHGGLINYLPPEEFEAQAQAGATEEGIVYRLGCLMCEMLTGGPPWAGEPMAVIFKRVCIEHQPPQTPAEIFESDPSVHSLITSCLSPLPSDRPSIRELLKRLEESITAHRVRHLAAALSGALTRRECGRKLASIEQITSVIKGHATRQVAATAADESVERTAARLPVGLRSSAASCVGLVRDTATRKYTPSKWGAVVAVTAALAYLASPIDAIPDAVPFVGLVDDMAVLCGVVGGVAATELVRYRAWVSGNRTNVSHEDSLEDSDNGSDDEH